MTKNKLSHVAFILDGNKRWAKKNNKSKIIGYKKGFENIKNIVNHSININLKYVTLFTLSSENFNRPSINIIYDIIHKNFKELLDQLIDKNNVKINILGKRENLPKKIIEIFNKVEELSKSNNKLNLNLAFNYGFKEEIKEVLKRFKVEFKNINVESDKEIRNLFYLGNMPDPDLLIRTGGYKRLSNFMMYNLTYSELFFTETLWPDFNNQELDEIINKYLNIKRKYGL